MNNQPDIVVYEWLYYPAGGSEMPDSFAHMKTNKAEEYMRGPASAILLQSETFHGLRLKGCTAKDGSGLVSLERVSANSCPFKTYVLHATAIHGEVKKSGEPRVLVKVLDKDPIKLLPELANPLNGHRIYVELGICRFSTRDVRTSTLATESRAALLSELQLYSPNPNDITFTFANEGTPDLKLFANRERLAKGCEYLASMIAFSTQQSSQFSQDGSLIIPIVAHDYASFNALLKFIYIGESIVFATSTAETSSSDSPASRKPQAKAFYRLAHEMNMPVLQKQAMEEIMQRLNASSAREELMSEFCRDYKEVQDAIFQWILEHPSDVLKAEGLPIRVPEASSDPLDHIVSGSGSGSGLFIHCKKRNKRQIPPDFSDAHQVVSGRPSSMRARNSATSSSWAVVDANRTT